MGHRVGQRYATVPVVLGQAEDQPGADHLDLPDDVHPARGEVGDGRVDLYAGF